MAIIQVIKLARSREAADSVGWEAKKWSGGESGADPDGDDL